MPSSDHKMKPEDSEVLAEALLGLQSRDEVMAFLNDLCTPSEMRAFAERFKVARLLDEGQLSYREISRTHRRQHDDGDPRRALPA